jgi:hypothetical protein
MTTLAAVLAALALGTLLAAPALAWDDDTHKLIVGEAVARLPEPLHGLLSGESLNRLQKAALDPDVRRARLRKENASGYAEENARHFFDIDAMTDEAPPFAHFPRDRKAAEQKFGTEIFLKHGTGPWTTDDAVTALAAALKRGDADAVFAAAGDVAHYAADLHMPLHVTKNYDGKLTGSDGIHMRIEVGLTKRYPDFYAAEVAKGRGEASYVPDPRDRLFDWIIQAHSRAAPILAADTAARQATGYVPPTTRLEAEKEADDVALERVRPYYAALKKELEQRNSPEAAAMHEAAAHVADLLYTAWVNADKPVKLEPPPAAPAAEEKPSAYWLIPVLAAVMILLLFPRRRTMGK